MCCMHQVLLSALILWKGGPPTPQLAQLDMAMLREVPPMEMAFNHLVREM